MGEIGSHAEFLQSCHDNRRKAESYVQFRPALSPEIPKARFPGFRQGLKVFKAGERVQKRAKPLPVDLLMHESMSMVLSDGTKLYYDIFFPAGYEELRAVDEHRKIAALVAW
jgi:predicted acyl esterase